MDALRKPRWITPSQELKWRVQGFSGSRKAARKFLNTRAASYWNLRGLPERGKIAMPRDERLWDELCEMQWRTTSEGRIQIEDKEQLKGRLGRSPDRADAVSMAFAPSRRARVEYMRFV